MFRNQYQNGLLSILYSCGSSPLEIWGMHVKNGYIRRVTDEEVKSLALEITGTNVTTTYIFAPSTPRGSLGIRLPFLTMIIKNMKKYLTFEITILDDKNMRRRFRMSNFQSTTRIKPFCTSMPIGLSGGWNQIQFNLSDFTRRAYGTNYIETTRIQIHANCRIRRIYFADRLYTEDQLPEEFKLFLPGQQRKKCVRESAVDREKEKAKPEKDEDIEQPPFEADEGAEDEAEEGLDEEPIEDEAKGELREDEEDEEVEEDEVGAGQVTDYEAEDESPAEDEVPAEEEGPAEDEAEDSTTVVVTSPGEATEGETDAEDAAAADDEEEEEAEAAQ
ncbi:cilia- and flagella-associated protein 20 [Lasioglossum baleicum]|uniref:cilia- and flagella-associated protein 20 n=1 Tax=Lasioglossum baleicum TaxID=434251 RepID=UPI003FCE1ABC